MVGQMPVCVDRVIEAQIALEQCRLIAVDLLTDVRKGIVLGSVL